MNKIKITIPIEIGKKTYNTHIYVYYDENKKIEELNDEDIKIEELKLTRKQMISIIKNTNNEDWLFKSNWDFDAQTDVIRYSNEDFKPLEKDVKKWIIEQLENFRYYVYYNISKNVFKIFNIAIHSFELKPTIPLIVKRYKVDEI